MLCGYAVRGLPVLLHATVAESLGLPPENPCWDKTDDTTSTGNMFRDPVVTEIEIRFEEYVVDWYGCEVMRGDRPYSGVCCRVKPDIKVTIEKHMEEPLTYWVNDSWLDVTALPDFQSGGCWCLLGITELEIPGLTGSSSSASATGGTTWGNIKMIWK